MVSRVNAPTQSTGVSRNVQPLAKAREAKGYLIPFSKRIAPTTPQVVNPAHIRIGFSLLGHSPGSRYGDALSVNPLSAIPQFPRIAIERFNG